MTKFHDLIHERFLLVFVILLILSSYAALALTSETKKVIAISIEIFGVFMSVILLLFIFNILNHFRGTLRKGFNFIALGAAFQLLSLVYTLVFLRFNLLPIPGNIDIHHLLMVIGIFFITIAVFRMRTMIAELK